MVEELRIGSPHDRVASLSEPQSKVNVVERDCEILVVKASHMKKDFALCHNAGRADCRELLDAGHTAEIARSVARESRM